MRLTPFHAVIVSLISAGSISIADDAQTQQLAEGRFDMALDASKAGYVAPADDRYGRFPITLEAWVRTGPSAQDQIVMANEAANSGTRWALIIAEDSLIPVIQLPAFFPREVRGNAALVPNEWQHLAAILEPDRCRLILNGKVIAAESIRHSGLPSQKSGLGIGVAVDDRRRSSLRIDDVRISAGVRDILVVPSGPLVKDSQTVSLWSFDESEADYLAHWTPGGLTNQRDLPYAHRIAEYEFDLDPDWIDARWQQTAKGPALRHSTQIPGHETSPKNIVLPLDSGSSFAAMFDEQRCGIMAIVSAASLTTDSARFGLLRRPTLNGDIWFTVSPGKLWRESTGERPAVPAEDLDFSGTRLRGRSMVPEYQVAGGTVKERLSAVELDGTQLVCRTLQLSGFGRRLHHTLAELPGAAEVISEGKLSIAWCRTADQLYAIAVPRLKCKLTTADRDIVLDIPANTAETVNLCYYRGPADTLAAFQRAAAGILEARPDESLFTETPSVLWGTPVPVTSETAEESGEDPWVIDTVGIPFENPHKALFFITAVGFFSNGDAAVSTAHGDVWVVRGLDDTLNNVTWQRFATGLYQPLGLEVVDDQIYVLGRDELTRLHDTNGDGEADWYESFNHDVVITGKDHAYAMRLERDPEGNFYFVKSGTEPHGSALLKITADGSRLDVVARGFRHPYGLGVSPTGDVTVADNEGDWVPSSKIDLIRDGGFYGYLGSQKTAPSGLKPDPPLCYIPKVADNSCGGQVWNTSDRWGSYQQGKMLHLSWGRCTLYAVLEQQADDIRQAAVVRFPNLTFLSGSGEAEFSPRDGQLYVVGLNGWQTGAVQDGCLQRVRYTGKTVRMPEAFEVLEDGVRLKFTCPLDPKSATDPDNYQAEQWNYRWQALYGSFHYSVVNPDTIGNDAVSITAAEISEDGHSVFVKIPGMKPVDQFHLRTRLQSADGRPLEFDLYSTIRTLVAH